MYSKDKSKMEEEIRKQLDGDGYWRDGKYIVEEAPNANGVLTADPLVNKVEELCDYIDTKMVGHLVGEGKLSELSRDVRALLNKRE